MTMGLMVIVLAVTSLCDAHPSRYRSAPHRRRPGSTTTSRRARVRPYGTPVWRSPCFPAASLDEEETRGSPRGNSRVSLAADTTADHSDPPMGTTAAELIEFLVAEAQQAHSHLEQILSIIVRRIRDSNVIDFYNNLSTIRGFPPVDRHPQQRNLSQALAADYERVSGLAVFLEQAQQDTRPYRRTLTSAFERLTGVLCWLEQASLALCQPISYGVTREIMTSEVRHLRSSALRDTRNYLIGRDALILLGGMIEFYEGQLTFGHDGAASFGNCH